MRVLHCLRGLVVVIGGVLVWGGRGQQQRMRVESINWREGQRRGLRGVMEISCCRGCDLIAATVEMTGDLAMNLFGEQQHVDLGLMRR